MKRLFSLLLGGAVLAIAGTSAYGQLGAAAAGYAQAQQEDIQRKHELEMQRQANATALEIARIQAQRSAQPAQQSFPWESGNSFLQSCAASLDKADQPNSQTEVEIVNGIACVSFLRGLEDGAQVGVQFAAPNSPQVAKLWCTPDGVTSVQAGRVLAKYIRAHPETAHQRTALLATYAFREAFNCQVK